MTGTTEVPNQIVLTGLNLDSPSKWHSAASGDKCPVDNNTIIIVHNTSGSSKTLTITSQHECNYGTKHNINAVPIGDKETVLIGKIPQRFFGVDTDSWNAVMTWSATPGATLQWCAVE